MILSTTNINDDYEVIDIIYHLFTIKATGFFKVNMDLDEGFEEIKNKLKEIVEKRGGDGIIGCQFIYEKVMTGGGNMGREVTCIGTVIKLKK